eukprot:14693-Rhodomonas_salina.2
MPFLHRRAHTGTDNVDIGGSAASGRRPRTRYAVSGTDVACHATRKAQRLKKENFAGRVSAVRAIALRRPKSYALATRCPVLTSGMLVRQAERSL